MAKYKPMSWVYDTHLVLTNVDENCTESARSFITFNSSLGLDVKAPGKKFAMYEITLRLNVTAL